MGSFKALRAYADFEDDGAQDADDESVSMEQSASARGSRIEMPSTDQSDIKLAYTINLNLPTTTDIAVFNAIFKSLKEHLL